MPRTRRLRLLTVLWMLGALLWAQGALAGYLCPGVGKMATTAQMAQQGMPCAESTPAFVDVERPSLCHAHCQADHASADSYQPPALASMAQMRAVLTLALREEAPRRAAPAAPLLQREGGPSLAISHCCWRI